MLAGDGVGLRASPRSVGDIGPRGMFQEAVPPLSLFWRRCLYMVRKNKFKSSHRCFYHKGCHSAIFV